ncbi:MAG: Dyp-type peroxidase [Candidatus Nanopelagicales bacterium]
MQVLVVERSQLLVDGVADGDHDVVGPQHVIDQLRCTLLDGRMQAPRTYLAARKIAMHVDSWDAQPVATQERVFGRTKSEGAPLSGGSERTRPDFRATDASGARVIDRDSHVALAHSIDRQRMRILRRGYTYVDGTLPSGSPDAGLFFLAFNRDLQSQFIPMQRQLSTSDLMNQFVTYRSSSAFAIPPGVGSAGGFVGEGLFGA